MRNRTLILAAAMTGLLLSPTAPLLGAQAASPEIAAAIADSSRPQANKDLDDKRHPAELLTFIGAKRGDKISELVPGGGYVTRLLAKVVGPPRHAYATNVPTLNQRLHGGVSPTVAAPSCGTPCVLEQPFGEPKLPQAQDI